MTRVVLHGAGRMSYAVVQAVSKYPAVEIVAVVAPHAPDWPDCPAYFQNPDELEKTADVLIDFSLPDGTVTAAQWCSRANVALLSGVTGLHQKAQDCLDRASKDVPVLWSPNMSIGINLLIHISGHLSSLLGRDTNIVIEDRHHQWKKDVPSGTALILGEALARSDRFQHNIHYESVREGEIIGEHEITFELDGERIRLGHEAQDRQIFAKGAVEAAIWLGQQAPGRYTSADWLSLNRIPEK